MNNDPTLNANQASRHGRKIVGAGIGILIAGASFVACDSPNDEVNDYVVPKSEFEGLCDNAPFALSEYEEKVGVGPFAPNEAALAEVPNDVETKLETATDLGQGNAMVALLQAQLNQQNSAYSAESLVTEAETIFKDIAGDKEKFSAVCSNVVENLMTEGVGVVTEITDKKVTELTNQYTDGVLSGLTPNSNGETQFEIPVIGFKDLNGAVMAGIVINAERNGRFVMVTSEEGASPEITDNPETVEVITNPETGVEVPVTYVQTPDGEIIPVTIDPTTGEQVPVNPANGEPTGEPIPAGSTPVPSPNGGGTGTGTGGETTGSGPSHSGPGTSQPGTVDTEPGVTSGPTTTEGPGTTTGPTTTVGGPSTTTGGGTTTTTTVRPTTTTTTVRPTTTTTTTVKPTTTTTTVKPTTTTTTTTVKPTTTTSEPWKPPVEDCADPVFEVCE